MSNHADMQVKYCGDCYDVHPIQSQYKGGGLRPHQILSSLSVVASNILNIIAVTTILVLHVIVIEYYFSCH